MSGKNSIQVAIKVRPLLSKDKDQQCHFRVVDNCIQLLDSQTEPYCFDHIFDQDVNNQVIFDKMAKEIVHSAIKGFNGTIFAYGQTSSGKTYTMMGDDKNPGVMILAVKEIFKEIEKTQDRQFLIRVCYIEIYNEKIHDLLNKKNQDLKVHETSTGIVSVNCQEFIITSENELLDHLNNGNKERKVGETNMNERSSRSHAIFRIIIESRKLDRSADDTIIQSVINLVDLAGSERADQTGARGARLKEGGHINKSLFFLSNVIKQLSENEDEKYVGFRDSKLTRILQASLGGNALTAIICTIKPNAIEETQSTLSFALRAKSVKNKPMVNETVSDATMMKRLEQENKILKSRLEEELRKNESQIKISQLEQRIRHEELKIISSNSLHSTKLRENRRRTWCTSSTNVDAGTVNQPPTSIPIPTRLPVQKLGFCTPLITLRQTDDAPTAAPTTVSGLPVSPDNLTEIDEEFVSAEQVNFAMLSPIKTELPRNVSITPKLIGCVQSTCVELQEKLRKLINSNEVASENIAKYEAQLEELKKINEKLEMENREAINLEFEFKGHKTKSKLRENELLEALSEKDKQISKLEKSLNSLSAERLKNSKEELFQKSLNEYGNADEDGKISIKCEDLERLLEDNKKVTLEFDKLTLIYEGLKLNYEGIEKENEANKLKIVKIEEHQEKEKADSEKLLLEVQKLKEQLQDVHKNYDLLKSENSLKQEECFELSKQIEAAKQEMVVLEEKFTKLEISWQEQQQTISDIEIQYATIQKKYEQLQNQYEELEATRGQSLSDYQRLEKENFDLQTEIEDLKKKVQVAQQTLLENNNKYEEAAKETKSINEEYSPKASKIHKNEELKNQLEEIQTQFGDLQKEYDDLSNQLLDSLQDNELLKKDNKKLAEKLEDFENKNDRVIEAELEINVLKCQLEKVLSNERKNTPPPARKSSLLSSSFSEEEEKILLIDNPESEELFKKFCILSESLSIIELEYSEGKTKLFKSVSKSSTPTSYKMYLKNILGVNENQKEFDMEIGNIQLQGSFKQHSFHIIKLSGCGEDIFSETESNNTEYIEKLKQEIFELKALLENTECSLAEMREQITQISAELLEKSMFVENCACKTYQQQIENLQKEKADITLINEELQEKVNSTFNSSLQMNITTQDVELKAKFDDNLNQLEKIKQIEQELTEYCDSQTKTLEERTQRCVELETELQISREQEQMYKETCNQLQLENLQKLEISASEYRDNIKKYNKVWEEKKEEYEQIIKDLQFQINNLKQIADKEEKEKIEFKLENISYCEENEIEKQILGAAETLAEKQPNYTIESENIEVIKQEEEEDLNLSQLITKDEYFELLRKANNTQREKITLYSKLNYLEKLLADAKAANDILDRENSSLKTELDDIRKDLNFLKVLHGKNQQVSDYIQNLNQDYLQLKLKSEECTFQSKEEQKELSTDVEQFNQENEQVSDILQPAEKLIEVHQTESGHEELTQILQAKLEPLTSLKTEKQSLINNLGNQLEETTNLPNDYENLRQEYKQMQAKLRTTEERIEELQNEDANREDQLKILQNKLECLTSLEEAKNKLSNEYENFQHEYKEIQEKLLKTERKLEEFEKENTNQEELLKTLKTKLDHLKSVEAEKNSLASDYEGLQHEYKQAQDNFLKTQQQIQELCIEDSSREELIQSLQIENKNLKNQVTSLERSETRLELEKTELKNKFEHVTNELQNEIKSLEIDLKLHIKNYSVLQEDKEKLEQQLNCLKQNENDKERFEHKIDEIVNSLELVTEKVKGNVNLKSQIRQEKQEITRRLQTIEKNLIAIVEKHEKQLEDLNCKINKLEEDKEKTIVENNVLQTQLQAATDSLITVQKDLNDKIIKLEEEKEKTIIENNVIQTQLQAATDSLITVQKDLNDKIIKLEEDKEKTITENNVLQTQLQAATDSLITVQKDQQIAHEQLKHFQNLQEDKNKLEVTLNVLKKAQTGAVTSLQDEKDKLLKTLKQYEEQNNDFKEKEKTLMDKIDSLSQQLHEMRLKSNSYEKLILEHEELENALTSMTIANQDLQEKVAQLNAQQESNISKIENLSNEIDKHNAQFQKQIQEKQALEEKLSKLEDTLQGEEKSLKKENNELKSSLEELNLKLNSLQLTNTQLDILNQQLTQQINSATEKLTATNDLEEKVNELKVQHSEMQHSMNQLKEEAERCSLNLRQDVEHHKKLLKTELERNKALKLGMENKQQFLREENLQLSAIIETVTREKNVLTEQLRQITTIRNFEQDLQRQTNEISLVNTSTDSNTSHSPIPRKSLERLSNICVEEKIIAKQQKNSSTTVERKNRRSSTHDERRRQSYWEAVYDKETMTDPMDDSCNCIELDKKLKQCERNLFIKTSQVTALSMELKNHPLIDENASLKKRLQDEQDKYNIEIKRCKNKLYEQTIKAEKALATAAHLTAISTHSELQSEQTATAASTKVVTDAETQTTDDLNACIQKLQSKYNDIKNLCRHRYKVIQELQEKVTQKENSDQNCDSGLEARQVKADTNQLDSLQKEMAIIKEKYENAKKVLHSRREEIRELRNQLGQIE